MVGLIDLLLPGRFLKTLAVALLVGFAIGLHVRDAYSFRYDWIEVNNFFWQLKWRAPDLKADTILLTDHSPMLYETDNSFTGPLNWIYDPLNNTHQLTFALMAMDNRLGNVIPGLQEGLDVHYPYRTLSFNGSTSQIVVFHYDHHGCLEVLDPELDALNPLWSDQLRQAASLSKPDRILTSSTTSGVSAFSGLLQEPGQTWCYFYEKASLAQQVGDWDSVVKLGNQAFQNPEKNVKSLPTWLVYIEGYAYLSQWGQSQKLSEEVFQLEPEMRPMLCGLWNRIASNTPSSTAKTDSINAIHSLLSCTSP